MFLVLSALPVYGQPATNMPPTLAPAYDRIPPTFWEQHGTVMFVGSFIFVALAALILWKLIQPKPSVILPPELVAREALAKLQGQPEDGKLLSEVSQILRRYFSTAFRLPATEMTTAEFCAELSTHEKIGAELAQMIASFLRVCDKDKFSPQIVAPPMNTIDRARELISYSEARRIQPATANPPPR